MSKKMKILASVLVAVLLLTVGGTTLAMAQEEEEPEPQEEEFTPQIEANALLTRVAEILGISEEELREAFHQARQEMMEERWEKIFNQALDKAVDEGLLTPEEAEEIREWWAQKPEALNLGLLRRAFGLLPPHVKPMPGVRQGQRPEIMPQPWQGPGPRAWHNMGPEDYDELLERALANGRLAQEDADKLREWLEKRPEVSNGLSPRVRIFKAFRARQMSAIPKGWQSPLPYQTPD